MTRILTLAVAFLALAPRWGNADQTTQKPSVDLMTPKEGAVVARVEEYEGRIVNGGWPVVYVRPAIKNGKWWIQPSVEEVVDGQFTGRAYFGEQDTPNGTKFEVVILVVKNKAEADKLRSGTTAQELPDKLPRSKEVTVVRDVHSAENRRTLNFANYTWQVKAGRRLGPGPNDFSDANDNVWLDDKQRLHLAITKTNGRWQCAEVVADKSLGHGEYRWVVSGDFPVLDRRVVLGLFTYESTTQEIDFELARWDDANKANAQFVVQPYTVKDSTHRFDTSKAKLLTVSLLWEKGLVHCRCWDGEDTAKEPLADWKYTGRNVPQPGKERARANLWLFEGRPPSSGERQEVILHSFQFTSTTPPKQP